MTRQSRERALAALVGIEIVHGGAEATKPRGETHLIHFIDVLAAKQRDAIVFPGAADAREGFVIERSSQIDAADLERLPLFKSRLEWFLANRPALARHVAFQPDPAGGPGGRYLLAVPTRERLARVLTRALDEQEFLSPFGIRSLSREHAQAPGVIPFAGDTASVHYAPGESDTPMFGGNSNWRGPVWIPLNYLLAEALKRHHHFYGDTLDVECPTGSGRRMNLLRVAEEIEGRVAALFTAGADGQRPCLGGARLYSEDPAFRDLLLYHEYFHGDNGRGLGASHQTGWTALVANLLERVAFSREAREG